ncbi:MAG TPA: DSD1 family PLP-dependent enzyme, partial [Vicinamibacteria bacterium]|nr:DSD1 family PLP-dependent enzyme [Vicinamibacteria bacterium]
LSRRGFLGTTAGGAFGMSLLARRAGAAAASYDAIPLKSPMSLWDLPTPALVIDEEAMESNLDKMASFYQGKRAKLRPHTKTHKCPILAKKQIAKGAVGVCAAKVGEAEVMVEAGIENVLITSPVVTRDKMERVVALAKKSPGVSIVVDQERNVRDFDDAARSAGVTLPVLIDLNVGTDRTGIALGKPALDLAETIRRNSSLKFLGLQAYAGHLQHLRGFEYRRQASEATMGRAVELRRTLEKAGFEVPILTGGGTGTYNIDSEIDGITDVQVGSYLFMDVNYRNVGGQNGPIYDDFRPSLLVLATAISQPAKGRITIDAGYKAFATDQEPPDPLSLPGVSYRWAGDEHGVLEFRDPRGPGEVKLGDKVLLIASHCDPTVNLYDHYYPFRNERVEEMWPISARGKSQ